MWTRFSHTQIYVISKIVFCRFWNVPKGVDSSWPPFVQALLLLLRFVAVVSMAAASPSSRRCCGASLQIAISSTTLSVQSNPVPLNAWSSIDWVHKGCIVELLQLPFSSVFLWALLIDQEDGAGMVWMFQCHGIQRLHKKRWNEKWGEIWKKIVNDCFPLEWVSE